MGYFRWVVRNSLSLEVTRSQPRGYLGEEHSRQWEQHKGLESGTDLEGVKMKKKKEQGIGWEFGGHVLGGGQDGNTGSSPSTPAGGAVSSGLPSLGCGQAGKGRGE